MSTGVTVFNPASLADRMRDKLRLDIFEAMTDEERQSLVRSAIDDLTKDAPEERNQWGNVVRPGRPSLQKSIVETLLREEITKLAKLEVGRWASDDIGEGEDSQTGRVLVKKVVEDFVRDNAHAMIREMLEQAIGRGLGAVLTQLYDRNRG